MKKADPQHLLEAHIPWYQTRRFWGILIALQILFSIISFYQLEASIVTNSIAGSLFYATGGGVFFLLSGLIHEYIYMALYALLLIFLGWNTFRLSRVKVLYPIFYLIVALFSTYLSYLFIFRIY